VMATLLQLYKEERVDTEEFSAFVNRVGESRLRAILEPWRAAPSFEADPIFYQDYGHDNERFAVRPGVKGECAERIVPETVPQIDDARELIAQAEAFLYHKEYEHAMRAAYEAAAAAARVPLYARLVDSFTSDEVLWEFENLFVLSGQTKGDWQGVSARFLQLKNGESNETGVKIILDEAGEFVTYCATFSALASDDS